MEVTVIVLGAIAIAALILRADIKITITHNYPQPTVDKVDNSQADLEKKIDETYEKEALPTFDDVLKLAQEMIGGEPDAN